MARDTTVLLIEGDPAAADLIRDVLEASGYRVWWAEGGTAGQAMFNQVQPSLVILNTLLPDADGLVLCADLRAQSDVPIIVCSATGEKRDTILALKLGADDVIPIPFMRDDVLARVEAVLRRARREEPEAVPAPTAQPATQPPRVARMGALTVDHSGHQVKLGAREVGLTPTEYRLLTALLSHPGKVLSRQELAQMLWGDQDRGADQRLQVHVYRLRVKLREAQAETGLPTPRVMAMRGAGVKIEQPTA